MEVVLLILIVLILGALMVAISLLVRTTSKLSRIEEFGLHSMESSLKKQIDMVLPVDMQARFEAILSKHEKYLDELLRTTTNSFDQKLHKVLDISLQNQIRAYQSAISQQQDLMLNEIKQLSNSMSIKKHSMQTDIDSITKDIKLQYQRRMANHFAELAWQYINEALSDSVDLHSQKAAIYKNLNDIQKQLKKDFSDVDKIT
jgi:hypothetical protein